MQQDLLQIEKDLLGGGLSPHEAADHNIKLAGWYSYLSGQLEEVLARRPSQWNHIMAKEDVKSAKAADREYEASEDGLKVMRYKSQMDRIDRMKQSLRDLIYVYSREARNQM